MHVRVGLVLIDEVDLTAGAGQQAAASSRSASPDPRERVVEHMNGTSVEGFDWLKPVDRAKPICPCWLVL